jgi:hypothetical protein
MKMVLSYDGRVITGYILKLVNELTADQYMMKQFSFTVLVESEAWFRMNPKPDGKMGLNHMSNTNRYGQGAAAEIPAASPSAQPSTDVVVAPQADAAAGTDQAPNPTDKVKSEPKTEPQSFGLGAAVGGGI